MRSMPVMVGTDEFCSTCMEWREYDEEGRCKVCKKMIKKHSSLNQEHGDDYKLEEFDDEDIESEEF